MVRIYFACTFLHHDDVDDNSRICSQTPGNEEVMTSGPPPSAASSSKSTRTTVTTPSLQHQNFGSPTSLNATLPQKYYRQDVWNAPFPYQYYGYPTTNTAINSVAYPAPGSAISLSTPHVYEPPIKANPHSSNRANAKPVLTSARSPTPPPPDPETFRHWDEVIKKFLVSTKMNQTLKGLESDMLVLNPDWEQEAIPEALKEMVQGLQVRRFFSFPFLNSHILIDYLRPCIWKKKNGGK